MKHIAILGSTGSIGQSALAVVDAHADKLRVVGLAAGENAELLASQIERYAPSIVAMATGEAVDRLRTIARLKPSRYGSASIARLKPSRDGSDSIACQKPSRDGSDSIARPKPSRDGSASIARLKTSQEPDVARRLQPSVADPGRDGLIAVASHPDADVVLCASSGTEALEAVLAAIECGKTIALANKEVLVMAGGLVTEAAARRGVAILPVDSEHNAIHQCLHGHPRADVKRLVLTASGGPFRGRTAAELADVSAADALKHPTWRMGRKITIDSATLMNKGLEVIEAHWLFGVRGDQIGVVIHPQSVVHSLVEFVDGSILAQLGVTDMRLPIQYAFSYPERWGSPLPPLDLARAAHLDFETPDTESFPCLRLAYRALEAERSLPVVLNAANEVAVARFLEGRIGFTSIPHVIESTMDAHRAEEVRSLAAVRSVDQWARDYSQDVAGTVELKL